METLIVVILAIAAVALVVRLLYSTVLGIVFAWVALRQLPKTTQEFKEMSINEQLEILKKLKELGRLKQMNSIQSGLDVNQRAELRDMATRTGIDLGDNST